MEPGQEGGRRCQGGRSCLLDVLRLTGWTDRVFSYGLEMFTAFFTSVGLCFYPLFDLNVSAATNRTHIRDHGGCWI